MTMLERYKLGLKIKAIYVGIKRELGFTQDKEYSIVDLQSDYCLVRKDEGNIAKVSIDNFEVVM